LKHLAMAISAALMLGSIGASAAAATAGHEHRVDRRLHQHQGIGGPHTHHGGKHRRQSDS
jgi:hypothetical protein